MTVSAATSCPFCPFSSVIYDDMVQHVDLHHPENGNVDPAHQDDEENGGVPIPKSRTKKDAPNKVEVVPTTSEYMECECGETVALAEFEDHRELHLAENIDDGDSTTSSNALQTNIYENPSMPNTTRTDIAPRSHIQSDPRFHSQKDFKQQMAPLRTPSPRQSLGGEGSLGLDLPYRQATPRREVSKSPSIRASSHKGRREKYRPSRTSWLDALLGTDTPRKHPHIKGSRKASGGDGQLGKKELGPFAYEERMPVWLEKKLLEGAKVHTSTQIGPDGRLIQVQTVANETQGLLPVIAQLCDQDSKVYKAYLCHPGVQHVSKLEKEGGFCGYRNIQMLISYIQATTSEGHEVFPGGIPSIFRLQDLIEEAWDRGIHPEGRIETGGIRSTRKFIGTLEAQTLFEGHNIGVSEYAYETFSKPALLMDLLRDIEDYFRSGVINDDDDQKICFTNLPPVYFQHLGHSLTVVGFEERVSGRCNLLVFDPMYRTSPAVKRLVGTRFRAKQPEKLLKAYRRGPDYLKRHQNFEFLLLHSRATPGSGWNKTIT